MGHDHTRAFAPGRVNLIGEHTDYNEGLALPFAIAEGVTVQADTTSASDGTSARIEAYARDLDEHDEFPLDAPRAADGWRGFLRGAVAELAGAGYPLRGARLQISGDLPRGAGLSSSAALEVALCLALADIGNGGAANVDRMEMARLCARVENEWVGAQTGLLDQLASLFGAPDTALCIDFQTLDVQPVPLALDGWRLVVVDSGERHAHASSGYNERRAECAMACELLGVASLRELHPADLTRLPEPLDRRASHVIGENERVRETVSALEEGDLAVVGELLDASHESLRDRYQVSTPAVEVTVERLRRSGAAGARMVGGGFGGSVLGLFDPDTRPPADAREVRPGPGARLLAAEQ